MREINILYLYGYPWDYLTGRPQQFSKRLANHGKVLYVETPISFLTALSQPKKLLRPLGTIRKVKENLHICAPPLVLPFSTALPFILKINSWICGNFINRLLRKLHFDDYVILSYSSLAVHLLAQLKKTIVFYDCADDHAAWKRSNRNRRQIELDEPLLAKKAAAIFVVSKILKEKFSLINENTFLIPNGVEIEHFKKSCQNPLLPQDMLGIKGPIIGFIGVVSDLFDLGLLEAAARIKPEWSFVIVGPITSNIIKPDLKNIHFLGKKSYEELPSYLTTFDVCTIPLNRSPAALGANPAKLFQYLAGGKPVVSVDLPEVETFSDLIYISKNEKEFIDNIDVALKEANPKIRQKRIIEARRNTWDQRVEMMVNIISRFEGQRTAKPLKKNLV